MSHSHELISSPRNELVIIWKCSCFYSKILGSTLTNTDRKMRRKQTNKQAQFVCVCVTVILIGWFLTIIIPPIINEIFGHITFVVEFAMERNIANTMDLVLWAILLVFSCVYCYDCAKMIFLFSLLIIIFEKSRTRSTTKLICPNISFMMV